MPKSTGRRISLQPVFEPFDLLDGEAGMQPLPTNGFHAESFDEDASLFAGLHCEPIDAAPHIVAANGNGSAGNSSNGTVEHGATPDVPSASSNSNSTNDAPPTAEPTANDNADHAPVIAFIPAANGTANGVAANGAAANGAHHAVVNGDKGASDMIAIAATPTHSELDLSELDADPDLADLAAAKEAFAEVETDESLSAEFATHSATHSNGEVDRFSFSHPTDERASTDHELAAEVAAATDHVSADVQAGGETNGEFDLDASSATAAASHGAGFDVHPHAAGQPVPPPVEAEPPVDDLSQSTFTGLPEAEVHEQRPAAPAREPHPAAGSMFVPYLVTEIRELRSRTQRRRSWWRRIFG